MTNTLQPTKRCPGCGATTRSGFCDPCLDTPKETTMAAPRLEQIKGRLEAATPGPWFQGREDDRYEDPQEIYSEREVSYTSSEIGHCDSREDAALVAHAPADIGWLIEQLEVARETNTRLNYWLQEARSYRARRHDEYVAGGSWATNRVQELAKHLDHWESQRHGTVGIDWLRRHFGLGAGR